MNSTGRSTARPLACGALLIALVLLLGWAPLPLGSNRTWAAGLLVMATALLTPLAVWALWSSLLDVTKRLALPLYLFAAILLYVQVQSFALPVDLDHLLRAEFGYVAAALAFAFAFALARQRSAYARWLLLSFAAIACCHTLYGFIEMLNAQAPILWFDAATEDHRINATFVNRNTFATYAGLGLIVVGALLSEKRSLATLEGLHATFVARTSSDRQLAEVMGLIFAALLLAAALLLSESRGAILATMAAGGVLTVLRLQGQKPMTASQWGPLLVGAGIFALLLLTAGAGFLGRLFSEGALDTGRVLLWESTLRMIASAPLFGHGLGSWEMAFPAFHPEALPPFPDYDKAHNGYLEIISDLGIPFGLLFLAQFGWMVQRLRTGMRVREKNRLLPQLGLALSVLIGIHSALDYSLQIPAISFTFAVLMGVCVGRSYATVKSDASRKA